MILINILITGLVYFFNVNVLSPEYGVLVHRNMAGFM
jgi:hypothetical protein